MKTKQYKFTSDPGHGWLVVPFADLEKLGMLNKISGYSYINRSAKKRMVYLEEDCDAPFFISTLKEKGITVKVKQQGGNSDRMSKVRSLPSFPTHLF